MKLNYSGGAKVTQQNHDPVNHPKHYTDHPSGIECIQITRHMGFNLGNAIKYIWRAGLKDDEIKNLEESAIKDLKKAMWYIQDEIAKRTPCCADGVDVDCEQGRKCPRNCK